MVEYMTENTKYRIAIWSEEFHQKVLDYITSNKVDEIISHTIFAGDDKYKQAIIQGMCIAALITSSCEQIYITEKPGQ